MRFVANARGREAKREFGNAKPWHTEQRVPHALLRDSVLVFQEIGLMMKDIPNQFYMRPCLGIVSCPILVQCGR
jgi:hypothetical protein